MRRWGGAQDLIITAPSVVYRCGMNNGEVIEVANPSVMPDASQREWIEEPFVKIEMITPKDYVGTLMEVRVPVLPVLPPSSVALAWQLRRRTRTSWQGLGARGKLSRVAFAGVDRLTPPSSAYACLPSLWARARVWRG